MRKVLRTLPPVLALLLVATMAQAATAPKPGAVCTKAGQSITVNKKDLQIEGLKAEKRMIQSTDRKMFDVSRQTEIDKEIEKLSK